MLMSMLYVLQLHHKNSALILLESKHRVNIPFPYMRAKCSSQLLSVYLIAHTIFGEKLKSSTCYHPTFIQPPLTPCQVRINNFFMALQVNIHP
jgi:hypothetical protein